jgi:oligoribonuclease (3'-5' exoribonuclease)
MKLLWLDCETDGLDPINHRLLEVAALVTDLTSPFQQEGGPVHDVLPVADGEAEAFDPFIIDMHTKNGLLLACKEREKQLQLRLGADSLPRQASRWPGRYLSAARALEERILALIPKRVDVEREHITALAGSSVHFDLAFLRAHMPTLAANLSHRVLDVSAVKLFCRSLGMPKLPPEESMNHAIACAHWLGHAPVRASLRTLGSG